MKKSECRITEIFRDKARQIYNDYSKGKIPQSTLYHYTNLNGLEGILKNRELWFTEYKKLDDREEINYAISTTKNEIKKFYQISSFKCFWSNFLNIYPNHIKYHSVYTASFCEKADYLPIWNKKYGNFGKGYSIGFQESYFQPPEHIKPNDSCVISLKINYGEDNFKSLITRFFKISDDLLNCFIDKRVGKRKKDIINISLGAELASQIIPLMPGLKQERFSDEMEYRLYEMEFKINNKCYPVEIPVCRKIGDKTIKSEKFNYNDICEIFVGPCLNFNDEKTRIENILKFSGYGENKILIKRSNCHI